MTGEVLARLDDPGENGRPEATLLFGTSDETLANRLSQKAAGPTETPVPDDGDGDGGPITRFTNSFSPLGMAGLEQIGLSGHEIADAVQMRVNELYRNEFPVLKPRFERKCRECETEFDEQVEHCPECGGDVREPDVTKKRRTERLFQSVNKEGQSLRDLAKAAEWDQWLTGAPIIVIRYNYRERNGEIIHREPEELVKGDPKRIVPVVDENRRVGGYWYACPRCRHRGDYEPSEHRGRCEHDPECDLTRREVYFAERDDSGGYDDYYFREEIITFPWAFPRLHGLDGLSAVHHVWLKQLIVEFQDNYAGAFFDPESERLPNQFIVLHTTNPDAWEQRLAQAREDAKDDVYDSPIFANEYSPQDDSTPEVQVVDAMPDELLGQNEQLKDTLKKDIRQAFNISDVFDSDLSEAGGLNNEGLQIEVTDRSIASQQHDYVEGWLDTLAKRLGIDDWRIEFIPSTGPDADDLRKNVEAGTMAEQAGLDATFEDGQVNVADGEFDVQEAAGGMGGGFGDAPRDERAEGKLARKAEADDHVFGPAMDTEDGFYRLDPDEAYCEDAGEVFDQFDDAVDDNGKRCCPFCGDQLQNYDKHHQVATAKAGAGPPPPPTQKARDPAAQATELLFDAHRHLVWPDLVDQKAREPFWSQDEDVPEFVQRLIEESIGDAITTISEDIRDTASVTDVRSFFEEKLTQPQGWSLRSLTTDYADRFGVSEDEAADAVRLQTKQVLDEGREKGYERQDVDDEALFKWVGPIDDDKTDASWEILEKTNPDHGGTPRPLDELQRIVREARQKHFPELQNAGWADSWQDRDTFVRHYD